MQLSMLEVLPDVSGTKCDLVCQYAQTACPGDRRTSADRVTGNKRLPFLFRLVFRVHAGAHLVLDLFTGLLDIVADIASDVLGGVADVLGRIFGNVTVVGDAGGSVVLVLADLAGAEQQKRDRERNTHGFPPLCGGSTPLAPFRLRLNS